MTKTMSAEFLLATQSPVSHALSPVQCARAARWQKGPGMAESRRPTPQATPNRSVRSFRPAPCIRYRPDAIQAPA